jgi:transposase
VAHLAEPVETRALRGRKRRAKTDREDARWLRELLADGRLPEAWIPPEHVRQWRSRARLRHTLIGRLCFLRGPEGIIIGLAEQLS